MENDITITTNDEIKNTEDNNINEIQETVETDVTIQKEDIQMGLAPLKEEKTGIVLIQNEKIEVDFDFTKYNTQEYPDNNVFLQNAFIKYVSIEIENVYEKGKLLSETRERLTIKQTDDSTTKENKDEKKGFLKFIKLLNCPTSTAYRYIDFYKVMSKCNISRRWKVEKEKNISYMKVAELVRIKQEEQQQEILETNTLKVLSYKQVKELVTLIADENKIFSDELVEEAKRRTEDKSKKVQVDEVPIANEKDDSPMINQIVKAIKKYKEDEQFSSKTSIEKEQLKEQLEELKEIIANIEKEIN